MPISDNIGAAIEQLRPELSALLGNDYSQFIAQLEASLARGNEDQVLELFEEKYPALYDRLLDILGQQGLPGDLRAAIDQLGSELPQVLGPDYPAFAAELQTLLQQGNNVEVVALFDRYPAAHRRLLAIRAIIRQRKEEATKGIDFFPNITLPGQGGTLPPGPAYWCESGHHIVYQSQVKKQDIRGRPLCPNPEHPEPLTDYPQGAK